jgi:hypothetical protein
MTLIAKPIVKNHSWIVTNGHEKVGNVHYSSGGYIVKLGNKLSSFDSTKAIENIVAIKFERPPQKKKQALAYAMWPTDSSKTYNDIFDIKRKLHLYTKTKKSKCYHAAGWFRIKMNDEWQSVFCPKYIFIQRYPYDGPFLSKELAEKE